MSSSSSTAAASSSSTTSTYASSSHAQLPTPVTPKVSAGSHPSQLLSANASNPSKTAPPSYWDITIVPNTEVLYRTELPEISDSQAIYTKTKNSVKSHDPRLEYNPDELFRYFLTHIKQKPVLFIDIKGYHKERIERQETYTDSHGHAQTRIRVEEETRTDFEFSFDLTSYVSDQWSHIVALDKSNTTSSCVFKNKDCYFKLGSSEEEGAPLLGDEPSKGWRHVLEDYTKSGNWFKEIHLAKDIPWDYEQLRTALIRAIRWTGYQHDLNIDFRKTSYKVSAFSPSLFSQASQSNLVKCLCIASCLWIVALPVYSMTRKRIQGRLQCMYPMLWGGQEFYERNAAQLVEAIQLSMKGVIMVAK
ncbi:hypothetical protein BC829DRAFT_390152 [Chytridium lagenaria]|nr:hypothetical protein BC829DRAFT_390152 [Chytridium lagenaria]